MADQISPSATSSKALTSKDFSSGQTVRWCPGCGDYAILKAVQSAMPRLGKKKEDIVFISGIGCAARFPYYMDTYGFHTIHGRAPALATGVKISNPDLSVWVVTGDGDSMAIGGNHFIHSIRRNVNLNILLFNNEIYGLTKGQYSPTSRTGLVTKSTPFGAIEQPFMPGILALGAGGTFFARAIDSQTKGLADILIQVDQHPGTSVLEILQNCVIFNDKTFESVTGRENAANTQLHLEHGQPMLFGTEKQKGLRLNGLKLEVVTLGENGVTEEDILVHDAHEPDPSLHMMLVRMEPPELPMAFGVIRAVASHSYNDMIEAEQELVATKPGPTTMEELLNSGHTWEIS